MEAGGLDDPAVGVSRQQALGEVGVERVVRWSSRQLAHDLGRDPIRFRCHSDGEPSPSSVLAEQQGTRGADGLTCVLPYPAIAQGRSRSPWASVEPGFAM
jgi:hypothetical protein